MCVKDYIVHIFLPKNNQEPEIAYCLLTNPVDLIIFYVLSLFIEFLTYLLIRLPILLLAFWLRSAVDDRLHTPSTTPFQY